MGRNAECNRAKTQEPNKTLGTPSKASIVTTDTLELIIKKLLKEAIKSFQVPDIPRNLIVASELVDAGCGLHLYKHGC